MMRRCWIGLRKPGRTTSSCREAFHCIKMRQMTNTMTSTRLAQARTYNQRLP